MQVPFVDLRWQWQTLKLDLQSEITQVLDSGEYILGQNVAALEREVANFSQAAYGVGVANGTDALTLLLKAFGVGLGDEVITTPFTFFATVEAILQLGAKPVFSDIDKYTYTIDAGQIERLVSKRTKAILPVHLFGLMSDMSAIDKLADAYGLYVIADACQAIGATWNGSGLGTFGTAAAISFFPTKNLGGYGDGGMILFARPDVEKFERIKRLRAHGSTQKYVHGEIGWNSRLDELQAAILRVKLGHLKNWNEERQRLAQAYDQAFSNLPVVTPYVPQPATHVYHLYTIATERRDELQDYLAVRGIQSAVYYPVPMHLQQATAALGHRVGDFPVAEFVQKRVLSLPLFPGMSKEQQDFVIANVTLFFTS